MIPARGSAWRAISRPAVDWPELEDVSLGACTGPSKPKREIMTAWLEPLVVVRSATYRIQA
jgi:hypothetical protein